MRKIIITFSFIFITIVSGVYLTACTPSLKIKSKQINGISAPSFSPSKANEYKLDNGLTIYFMQNNELPVISGNLYVKGGYLTDASFSEVELSAFGSMLRSGGTKIYSPNELDEILENKAASIESSYGTEYGTVSFSSLSSDIESIFPIFSNLILNPAFNEERLLLWKTQAIEGIRKRSEDPNKVASIALKNLLFSNTLLGQIASQEDVRKISSDKLVKIHKHFFNPQNSILVITGSISEKRLLKIIKNNLSQWKTSISSVNSKDPRREPSLTNKTQDKVAKLPLIATQLPKNGIFFIEKPFSQATVIIAKRGPVRHTNDSFAIAIFSEIFGGGFGSRIFDAIRVKRGLAYGAFAGIEPNIISGKNYIYLQTKSASTGEAFIQSFKELEKIKTKKVTTKEIDIVKRSNINSFIFSFDSLAKIVNRSVVMSILGYKKEYDVNFIKNVNEVSKQNVQDVAKEYWDIQNGEFTAIVVGNKEAYYSLENSLNKNKEKFNYPINKIGFDENIIW